MHAIVMVGALLLGASTPPNRPPAAVHTTHTGYHQAHNVHDFHNH